MSKLCLALFLGLFIQDVVAEVPRATLFAKDKNNKIISIALDSNNIPRKEGDEDSSPSINDFFEGSHYSKVCYKGPSYRSALELLYELVESANGDGDFWFEMTSAKEDQKKVITISVKIANESEARSVKLSFQPCED